VGVLPISQLQLKFLLLVEAVEDTLGLQVVVVQEV
jgi:hypothetical protein|tara:strand:+ start:125 stop:229 length:105 start_codon:yes stop_codon:yes gene_type:complete